MEKPSEPSFSHQWKKSPPDAPALTTSRSPSPSTSAATPSMQYVSEFEMMRREKPMEPSFSNHASRLSL